MNLKVAGVALNHCDYKMPARAPCLSAVVRADFTGTVVRLGKNVALTSGPKIGYRVARPQIASSRRRARSGEFAEYITETAVNVWWLLENVS